MEQIDTRRGVYNVAEVGYTARGAGERGVWSVDVKLGDVTIVGTGHTLEGAGLEAEYEVEKWLVAASPE